MEKGLLWIDYAVIGLFFSAMVGVGVFYSRRSRSASQFFGSDKTVPWWLSGVSFYMNSFSALAFVMYSALAYKFGWVPVTVSWLSVPAVLLGAWFLAVRWRRAAKESPIDFIATRYTPKMCRTLAVLGLPMQLLDNALKLLAIGTVVGVGMGFPLFWAICISGVIIVLYTFLGGLKATLVCDFIQFLVILAVVFVGPPLFFFPAMAARVFLPGLDMNDANAMNAVYATVCRHVLPAGMMGLVGGIAVGLAIFVAGGEHPFLREMVCIFPATAFATAAFLVWGTVLFPDAPAERAEVDAFFRQVGTSAGRGGSLA